MLQPERQHRVIINQIFTLHSPTLCIESAESEQPPHCLEYKHLGLQQWLNIATILPAESFKDVFLDAAVTCQLYFSSI